jgi:glutaredoxin
MNIPAVDYNWTGLSIKQPAASLIIDGYKPVENRKHGQFKHDTLKDKWICIHASLGVDGIEGVEKYPANIKEVYTYPKQLPRGKILGIAHIKGVYKQSDLVHDKNLRQWAHDGACIVFDTIVKLNDPIIVTGGLSFWKLKPDNLWKPCSKLSKKELSLSSSDLHSWRNIQQNKYYKQAVQKRSALCNLMLAIRSEEYTITYQETLKSTRILVYGKSYCSYSQRAKKLLLTLPTNIEWSYNDINKKEDLKSHHLNQLKGYSTVPIVFIDNVFIGGYTEFSNWSKTINIKH